MTGKAMGGEIIAPGPKGVDSKPFMLAHGEHVWTANEVDLVGGQPAMYRMRELARQGAFRGLADGGDPYGGWGQVASQSNVSYSLPSFSNAAYTDARQSHSSWQIDGAEKFDMFDLVDEIRRVMRDREREGSWT
ncbi:hypothetical protein [Pseudoclavibacter sp. JSM 162008]|uniref:hypothetical protein n=1 Tax=Pseudoclavibacter sp. JSM 162008 TaxID=3229855 RepID=UPI0035246CFF